MRPQAVIFDFGGVLCFHPSEQQWIEAAASCGMSAPQLRGLFWADRVAYDAGEDAAAYWNSIAVRAGLKFNDAMIAGMIRREIDFWKKFDTRVLNWTHDLRRSGIRTGILSNLPRPLGESLRTEGTFLDHFDQVTFSYELGVTKPQPEIYRHAIEGLQIAPGDTLFLDDRPENVEGALAAGLKAELFTTWEQFLGQDRERYSLPEPLAEKVWS